MAARHGGGVREYIRRVIGLNSGPPLPDGQLLEQYVTRRDEAAFVGLVHKYGPLVLGVCQRVLQDTHAAEDAFQATFLVLIRKAPTLDRRGSLGNWIYSVAYRTAVKARARAAQRRVRERHALDMLTKPNGEPGWDDLRPVIDEEINRLPEKYRAPLILCYLQGKTNQEAAQALGWPSGSVSRRMTKARELLKRRLVARGIALSGAVLLWLVADQAPAAEVSAGLEAATVKSALAFKAQTAGVVAPEVCGLAEEVLLALKPSKVLIAAKIMVGVMVGLGSVGAGLFTHAVLGRSVNNAGSPPPAPVATRLHCPGYFPRLTHGAYATSRDAMLGCLVNHDADVLAVAISPDGRFLASGGQAPDNDIRLWWLVPRRGYPAMGKVLAELSGHSGSIHSLAFAPDGRTLASGSQDGTIKLWDVSARRLRATLDAGTGAVQAVAYSPDGRLLVSGGADMMVRVWDPATGQLLDALKGHWGPVLGLAVSWDGRTLASASQDRTVKLWDLATRAARATLEGHTDAACAVAFSPDGALLASSGWDATVRLWGLRSATPRNIVTAQPYLVRSLCFTPDGRALVLGCQDRHVRLCDPVTLQTQRLLNGHEAGVNAVACDAAGKRLVTGGADQMVFLWRLGAGSVPAAHGR